MNTSHRFWNPCKIMKNGMSCKNNTPQIPGIELNTKYEANSEAKIFILY